MIDGGVTVGPERGARPRRARDIGSSPSNLRDVAQYLFFPGLWRVLARYRKSVRAELTGSLLKSAYLRECRKYCPILTVSDLLPYTAGIRAQAVTRDGTLVHDFLFLESDAHAPRLQRPVTRGDVGDSDWRDDRGARRGARERGERFVTVDGRHTD